MKSSLKGSSFENSVQKVLAEAQHMSRGRLTYKAKPTLKLQNGESRIPDFSVKIERPHEVRHFHIECQNRTRFSKAILEKIQHIRSKHHAKTFLFVYSDKCGKELRQTMKAEGIPVLNLKQLKDYLHDEALCLSQHFTASTIGASVQPSSNSTKLHFLSKTQVALHSHPDARSELEDFARDEPDARSVKGNADDSGRAFG